MRIENSIIALNKISELHVISRVPRNKLGGEDAESFYRQLCRSFCYIPSLKPFSANRYIRKLQQLFRRITFLNEADFLLAYAKRHKIDVIWFGYGNISYDLIREIKEKRPLLKVVCDTDSVWSRFILRELPYTTDPEQKRAIQADGERKEFEERRWVNLCDVTTAVSPVDAEYYQSIAENSEKVKLFSNVINLGTYSHAIPVPDGFHKPNFYLAGSFYSLSSPMAQGARWIIDAVLPLVRKELPDIHFYIIGKGSKEILHDIADPGITITGRLVSVLPYLCNADVALVPLAFESGTRFKILEAAACGIPLVSTTLGAEGIPVSHGFDIHLADDAAEFAQGIITVVRDKQYAKLLADNCNKLIQTNYSIDALEREALEILHFLKR